MSVISEKIGVAMFARLNTSPVTSLATGGVYEIAAPEGTPLPYVIFNRSAPGNVVRSVFGNNLHEDDLWMVKALADERSSTTKSAQRLCGEIVAACETALQGLTISGNTITYLFRERDIPTYPELVNGRNVFHKGFLLRIQAE